MKSIAKLEQKLSDLRDQLKVCTDPDLKSELEEKIDFIQDEVDEIEDSQREQESYEEMTGTSPQDLYNERNSYALHQSDMYDRFRAEY